MPIDLSKQDRTKSTTEEEVKLKGIEPPKNLETEMRKFNQFMVREIRTRFENQVLKKLNVSTIKKFEDAKVIVSRESNFMSGSQKEIIFKDMLDTDILIGFEDAQIGNYAKVFNDLVKKFTRKIKKQFSPEKLKKLVNKIYSQANLNNKKKFDGSVAADLGIDLGAVLKTDGLNSFINAKSLESLGMIEKLRDETVTSFKSNTLRKMSEGAGLDEIFKQVKKDTGLKLKSGDLVARNELKAFNSALSKKRMQNVGVKKAIWQNMDDERVRGNPSGIYSKAKQDHWTLSGKEYVIGVGLKDPRSGELVEPGGKINCRCIAIPIVEFN